MTSYTVVTAICLAYMTALLLFIVLRLALADRRGKMRFLKRFKRGDFALIFLAMIPLYFMGNVYAGAEKDFALWSAVRSCIDLVVLKFDVSSAEALAEASLFYRVTLQIGFGLVTLNAVLFVFSLFGQAVWNAVGAYFACRRARRLVVVVGYNAKSMNILRTAEGCGRAVLFCDPDKEIREEVLAARRACVRFKKGDDLARMLQKKVRTWQGRTVRVIVNTGSEEENLLHASALSAWIVTSRTERGLLLEDSLEVYVFGTEQSESAFSHFVAETNGVVRFVNPHKLIATDFIERYPLTQFMTERELDVSAAALRGDVDVNVLLIGFGKVNRNLFLASVSNNQFLTRGARGLTPYAVRYCVFDGFAGQHAKNLNHTYFRYTEALKQLRAHADAYLPLVDEPARLVFSPVQIDSERFYPAVRKYVVQKQNRRAYNYIVVSLGNDMVNFDLGEKLAAKLREWGADGYSRLFVRIADAGFAQTVVQKGYGAQSGIIPFGAMDRTVYDCERIVEEAIGRMAKKRHLVYTAEYCRLSHADEAVHTARAEWFTKYHRVQRESNEYACLSLRMKLQLCGYDVAPLSDPRPDCAQEFMQTYERGDPIRYRTDEAGDPLAIDGKRLIEYRNADFERASLRAALAAQEHQRWNANMICNGFLPVSIAEIRSPSKGKCFERRMHRNLTTFEGLKAYRRLMQEAHGVDPESADVIRYDYQIMDDAAWILRSGGYKIVKRQ